jgi:hypothetical protein
LSWFFGCSGKHSSVSPQPYPKNTGFDWESGKLGATSSSLGESVDPAAACKVEKKIARLAGCSLALGGGFSRNDIGNDVLLLCEALADEPFGGNSDDV